MTYTKIFQSLKHVSGFLLDANHDSKKKTRNATMRRKPGFQRFNQVLM